MHQLRCDDGVRLLLHHLCWVRHRPHFCAAIYFEIDIDAYLRQLQGTEAGAGAEVSEVLVAFFVVQ